MIQLGEDKYKAMLKAMWKRCFPADTDVFVAYYFDEIYQNDESLIYLEDGQPAAFLQMIPYSIEMGGTIYAGGYLSGIMTHPEYRNKGYMAKLLQASFDEMVKKGYDYTFLIPQEEWLKKVYGKFGFRSLVAPNGQGTQAIVLRTEAQLEHILWDFVNDGGYLEEIVFPDENKGMIKRLNPSAEEIKSLYMGMMLD
jgi:predicted acetyltransferase